MASSLAAARVLRPLGVARLLVVFAAACAAVLAAACGDAPGRITSCTDLGAVDVSDVGDVVALARFGDGYVVAGTRYDTVRIAIVDARGRATPASAIGDLISPLVGLVPLRAAVRADGARWTVVCPSAESLLGYSVDTETGRDSTFVYRPHFTNSEPIVAWMPTAFWLGPEPEEIHIAMLRVETAAGSAPFLSAEAWLGPSATFSLDQVATPPAPGEPIVGIDGRSRLAATGNGIYSYADQVPVLVAPLPQEIAALGPTTPSSDGLAGAATGVAGEALLVRFLSNGETVVRPAEVPGAAVGLLEVVGERFYAWLLADASLTWVGVEGDAAGPVVTVGAGATPSSSGVVHDGDEWAWAYVAGGRAYVARMTCE